MIFLVHFSFSLLIFLFKSALACLDDQCRILAFPSTLFFVGERLVDHTIANISVIDRDTCEYSCYLNHNCVSVNFYFGPSEAGIQNCELNNSTSKEHDKDLVKATKYVYHGTRNACSRSHCNNNAICQSGFTSKGYRCLCSIGFVGAHCEQDVDECKKKSHGCNVNAECHNTVGSFICKCKAGYVGNGQNCAKISGCGQNPCHNEGTCISQGEGYKCTCLQGFTGDHCETDIDDCASSACLNKGTCFDDINKYRCSCAIGFSGINCEIDNDECAQNTHTCSLTRGVCKNTPGSFRCSCKPGFIGDGHNCEGYVRNSVILSKNESHFAYLREFLVPAVGNDSHWLLCYRASLHGWAGNAFHTRCDGKKDMVIIIQKDQYVFGGYTDIPWAACPPGARTEDTSGRCCVFPFKYKGRTYDSCTNKHSFRRKWWCSFDTVYKDDWDYCDDDPYKGYRKTNKAFIFSLENKEGLAPFKSMVKHDSQAIYMEISYGPTFGGGFDIHIANNAGHTVHSYTKFGHSFLAPSEVEEKDTVLAGTHYFTPDEVEVFYLP